MSVRDAVIVSTARTPIGRAYKGSVQRHGRRHARLPVARPAIERAGIEAGEIDDVGGPRADPGTQSGNIGRQVALAPAARSPSAPRPSTANARRA